MSLRSLSIPVLAGRLLLSAGFATLAAFAGAAQSPASLPPAPLPEPLAVGTELVINNNGHMTTVTIQGQRPGATMRLVSFDQGKQRGTVVQPNNPFVPPNEVALPGRPVERATVVGNPDTIFPLTSGSKTTFQMRYDQRVEEWRCEVTGTEPIKAVVGADDSWVVVCVQSENGATVQTVRRNYAPHLGIAVIGTYQRHDTGATGRNQLMTMKRP